MAKEDNKVFDVAKPGETKPETGSKPMVVGHKIMKDPSVSEPENKESKDAQPIAQTSRKTITPISDQEDESENSGADDTDNKSEKKQDNTETESISLDEKDKSLENDTEETDINIEKEKSSEEKEKETANEALNNEENLQKIVSEKTYYVSIDEASYSSVKTFMKTFVIVGLLAVAIIAVLIDLEILDLGITLPFDYL